MTNFGIANAAASAGILKTAGEMVNGRPVLSWVVTCSRCRTQHKAAWAPTMRPEHMINILKRKRWYIGYGKQPKCPTCCNAPKKGPETVTTPTNGAATFTPPNPAPKIVRAVYALLEDHFDDGARRYKLGFDDGKIAKEAGCPTQIVTRLREDAFGKLAEDPRVSALRDEIELQRMEIDEFVKATTRKLDDMAQKVARVTA